MVDKFNHISHSGNRTSNTDKVENADSENNVLRSFHIKNPPVPFGKRHTN